jgi:hypothetical protein
MPDTLPVRRALEDYVGHRSYMSEAEPVTFAEQIHLTLDRKILGVAGEYWNDVQSAA